MRTFFFNKLQTSFLFLVSNPSTLKGGTDIARLKQFDRELDEICGVQLV